VSMSKLVVLLAVGGVLTLGDLALAGPLVTPTLFPGTATQVTCIVTNVGTKPADVTVQIVGAFSALVASQSTATLGPGLTNFTTDTTPGPSYCRAIGLSSSKGRLTLCMENASNNCISLATAP
jgi:hypothetical protein